VVVSR